MPFYKPAAMTHLPRPLWGKSGIGSEAWWRS